MGNLIYPRYLTLNFLKFHSAKLILRFKKWREKTLHQSRNRLNCTCYFIMNKTSSADFEVKNNELVQKALSLVFHIRIKHTYIDINSQVYSVVAIWRENEAALEQKSAEPQARRIRRNLRVRRCSKHPRQTHTQIKMFTIFENLLISL